MKSFFCLLESLSIKAGHTDLIKSQHQLCGGTSFNLKQITEDKSATEESVECIL